MEQTDSVGRSICSLNAPRAMAFWALLLALGPESLEWARERGSIGLKSSRAPFQASILCGRPFTSSHAVSPRVSIWNECLRCCGARSPGS